MLVQTWLHVSVGGNYMELWIAYKLKYEPELKYVVGSLENFKKYIHIMK